MLVLGAAPTVRLACERPVRKASIWPPETHASRPCADRMDGTIDPRHAARRGDGGQRATRPKIDRRYTGSVEGPHHRKNSRQAGGRWQADGRQGWARV